MSYRRDNTTSPIIDVVFSLAIIALAIAFVYGTSFMPWVSRVSHGLFKGGFTSKVGIEDSVEETHDIFSMSRKDMAMYIDDLETQNDMLRTRLLGIEHMQQENEQLRTMLHAQKDDDLLVATGRIIKRPPSSPYDTLIINMGNQQDVRVGDTVIFAGTVYLGDVVHVFEKTATVQMATTQNVVRDMRNVRTGIVLEAQGHNSSHVVLEVPRDIEVEEGDQLVDVLSNKLALTVYAITFDDREPFKTVYARVPVNVRYIDWVQVVR